MRSLSHVLRRIGHRLAAFGLLMYPVVVMGPYPPPPSDTRRTDEPEGDGASGGTGEPHPPVRLAVPPDGHPDRLDGHPPSESERELWARLGIRL